MRVMTPEQAVDSAIASAALAGVRLDDAWRAKLLRVARCEMQPDELIATVLDDSQRDALS